ncbi:lipoyl(octanoyl) transferase LipB [Schaalia sp. ZJ405]|uniref:lipoyl(octanoyl) transferase LipB n=1 Tax=Schaalia sp. ZJ405 TaxID=2709403 RepID=UPI0013EC287E|nr:lipoyl(octanoyl) transferase LipB [Schaalia sp. ZJ405]QPK82019.1 lipoyl(octanoyl) transferase LipB [Schaalia sp. ZJ405]
MQVVNLLHSGFTDYREVDAMQRRLHADTLNGGPDSLIVAQFSPTWTAGRHTKPEDIRDQSLPVIAVDRAGSVTWHGPGQVVIYPVVRLKQPVDLIAWIRSVEYGVIETVREEWGLPARRIEGRAGVWLTEEGCPDRKICAIGLKVAQGSTLHGIALNVSIDRAHAFGGIIPCGLADAQVASLNWEGITSTVSAAADALIPRLFHSIRPQLATPDQELETRTTA